MRVLQWPGCIRGVTKPSPSAQRLLERPGFAKKKDFSGLKGTQCQWPEFVRCYHAPGKPNVSGRMNCQIISIKYLDGSGPFYVWSLDLFFCSICFLILRSHPHTPARYPGPFTNSSEGISFLEFGEVWGIFAGYVGKIIDWWIDLSSYIVQIEVTIRGWLEQSA